MELQNSELTPTKYIWKDIDDENLISIIHENPSLWDNKRSDYRDTAKKQRIFIQISLQFPGSTPGEVEKRFTALKEKYRREKKKERLHTRSGSGAHNARLWDLLPKMEFIGRTMQPRETISFDPRPVSAESTFVGSPLPDDNLPETSSPTLPIFTSTPSKELKCPPSSSKGINKIREDFYKESVEAIKRIGETADNIAAQAQSLPQETKENHFKVFEFMAQESSSMQPNQRNRFIRDVMDVFWKYKLDENY